MVAMKIFLVNVGAAISSRILDPLPILPNSCLPHKHLSRGKTGKASRNSIAGTANGDINGLTPLSLSLTLDKLYVWEKRLYKEVKVAFCLFPSLMETFTSNPRNLKLSYTAP